MTLHWAVYSLALLLLSIAKYIPLPTLVPASLDIGEWNLKLQVFETSRLKCLKLQVFQKTLLLSF